MKAATRDWVQKAEHDFLDCKSIQAEVRLSLRLPP
jgi:hypothetical protein